MRKSLFIFCVNGISEKLECIVNYFYIKTVLKTKHSFRRSERNSQQIAECTCSIPCECGRSYIGKTGRPLGIVGTYSLREDFLEKSKLAQQGYWTGWDEARFLQTETNSRCREYKESAHMTCLSNPVSQPGLEISPIWVPLISKLQGSLVGPRGLLCFPLVSTKSAGNMQVLSNLANSNTECFCVSVFLVYVLSLVHCVFFNVSLFLVLGLCGYFHNFYCKLSYCLPFTKPDLRRKYSFS
jgi:hypothetical protein